MSEYPLAFCTGSIVMSDSWTASSELEAEWQFVSGRLGAWRASVPQDRLLLFTSRPTAENLDQAGVYDKVFGTCDGPIVETPLAQSLRAERGEAVTLLEADASSCETRGARDSFHLWAEPSSLVGAGSILRAIGTEGTDGLIGFELIDGYAYGPESTGRPRYLAASSSTVCLGFGWASDWIAIARQIQDGAGPPRGQARAVRLAGTRPPPLASDPDPDTFSPLNLNSLLRPTPMLSGDTDVPAIRPGDYLMVTNPEYIGVAVGSIVRARSVPEFGRVQADIAYGWSREPDVEYDLNESYLRHLGAQRDEGWDAIASYVYRHSNQNAWFPYFHDNR